jgi:hypothetical protein
VNVGTAGCFQHPPWYLQGPRTLGRFQTTANNRLPTPEADFVDPDRAAVPRMPRVMNFPRISAMGIVLMSCTITAVATWLWPKITGAASGTTTRTRTSDQYSAGRRSAPSLRTARCLNNSNPPLAWPPAVQSSASVPGLPCSRVRIRSSSVPDPRRSRFVRKFFPVEGRSMIQVDVLPADLICEKDTTTDKPHSF